MRVVIVDDNTLFINGLKEILNDLRINCLIVKANNNKEVVNKIRYEKFDYMILNPSMPVINYSDLIKSLQGVSEKDNVLLLSVHSRVQLSSLLFRVGASRALLNDYLIGDYEFIMKKKDFRTKNVNSNVIEIIDADITKKSDQISHLNLSRREFQVMCLLAKGAPLKEIGNKLFISEKTVTTYRSRLLEKMKMKSNSELALYAFKNDLIE